MVKGWNEKLLIECGEILQGLTYSPNDVVSDGLLVLRSSNIQNEQFNFNDCVFVNKKVDEKLLIREGDIVICVRNGSSKLIGKSAIAHRDYNATFGAFMSVFRSEYAQYIFQLFRSSIIQDQIRNNSSATINQITKNDFNHIVIPFPDDYTEQATIASVLSDMDEYIFSLERLIAKKKNIKQGTIQNLLTGKIRLEGFKGKWNKKAMDKIFKLHKGFGLSKEKLSPNGKNKCILYGEIFTIYKEVIGKVNSKTDFNEGYISKKGDLLLPGSTTTTGVDLIKSAVVLENNVRLGGDINILRPKIEVDTRFISYLLPLLKNDLVQYTQGITIIHLQSQKMLEYEISIPDDIKEQTAIVNIIGDMDAEIEMLQTKLRKVKLVKQGAMQQLLTGKIRIVKTIKQTQEDAVQNKVKEYSKDFMDAVIISAIVDKFYNPKYPLGRVKVTKLLYLFDRKHKADVSGFCEKAAGPYDPRVRYNGGEKIAIQNNYITITEGKQGTMFAKGKDIANIQDYIQHCGISAELDWLEGFKMWTRDELEVLATVDNARVKLEGQGQVATVESVISYIENSSEWKAKRTREVFADDIIEDTLKKSREMFN
ncbi:MAG: restriction endonuclease subunit S [Endomicrobiaceae bacterium]|nr:restriction endonuclease subunit S [Endomicrobiaceae bacterium]